MANYFQPDSELVIEGLDRRFFSAIPNHLAALDQFASELGVRPLSQFYSGDPAEIALMMDADGASPEDYADLPALEDFTAPEGFRTIEALAATPLVLNSPDLARELEELKGQLGLAGQHGMPWRLEFGFGFGRPE